MKKHDFMLLDYDMENPKEDFQKGYGYSEDEFYQILFSNFEELHNNSKLSSGWGELLGEAPIIGYRLFRTALKPTLDQVKEQDTPNGLQKLQRDILYECDFNEIKHTIYNSDHGGLEDIYYSLIPWKGKKYLVFVQDIYNDLNRIIDRLIEDFATNILSSNSDTQNHPGTEQRPGTQTPDQIQNGQQKPPESPTEDITDVLKGVRWKERIGSKADLAELIKGLYYVEAIEKDGNPIDLKDLQKIFESIFNIEIGDLDKSFRSRLESNKNIDNRLFLDQAGNRLDKMYREMAKEIRKERKKTP